MGYIIEYDPVSTKYEVSKSHPHRFTLLLAGALLVFLLTTSLYWPSGWNTLRSVLIPGEDAVTIHAAQNLAQNLKTGVPFKQALEVFCGEIIVAENVAD